MKKVISKLFLVAIQLVMILNEMVQTTRGLNVFNAIDDGRNTTPMKALKDEFLKGKIFSGFKIVRLANDRSGKKRFGFISFWESLVYSQDENGNGKMVILMATANPNPVITAVINAPDLPSEKEKLAEKIQTKASDTTYVTIDPALYGPVLTALILALHNAKGKAQVTKAWGDLNKQLKKIMAPVQGAMDDDPANSVIICEFYEFHAKGKGGDTAQEYSGKPGINVGEIDLIIPKGPDGSVYDIKIWNADRTTFTRAQPSDITHATIGGFVSGSSQNISVAEIRHGKVVRETQIIAVRAK